MVLIMFSTWKWAKTEFYSSFLFYFELEKTSLSIQRKNNILFTRSSNHFWDKEAEYSRFFWFYKYSDLTKQRIWDKKYNFHPKIKKICPQYDQLHSDDTVHCISMHHRALQCDVLLIEIMIIEQTLIHHYLSDPHLLFKWSKSLIVGPHLSGFESLGQTVTVGKGNSSMG